MSAKKFMALILFMAVCVPAMASDIQVWQDPDVDFGGLKKIFVMTPNLTLRAGNQLMPQKQLRKDFLDWTNEGIKSAFGKRSRILVKSLDSVIEDMKFIHGNNVSVNDPEFFRRASEMGYTAFITEDLRQEFVTEHVPETVRTYTEYREIEKRDRHGRLIETIRIPEEKTEIIPAHDVTYLYIVSEPRLYRTDNPNGDYIAAVNYSIYREYQGGPVMKVVENITIASMKCLFAGKK